MIMQCIDNEVKMIAPEPRASKIVIDVMDSIQERFYSPRISIIIKLIVQYSIDDIGKTSESLKSNLTKESQSNDNQESETEDRNFSENQLPATQIEVQQNPTLFGKIGKILVEKQSVLANLK